MLINLSLIIFHHLFGGHSTVFNDIFFFFNTLQMKQPPPANTVCDGLEVYVCVLRSSYRTFSSVLGQLFTLQIFLFPLLSIMF